MRRFSTGFELAERVSISAPETTVQCLIRGIHLVEEPWEIVLYDANKCRDMTDNVSDSEPRVERTGELDRFVRLRRPSLSHRHSIGLEIKLLFQR